MSELIPNAHPLQPPALAAVQAQAQAFFAEYGLPDRKTEHWKYTPLRQLWRQQCFPLLQAQPFASIARTFDGYYLVLHHGQLISQDALPEGIALNDWPSATSEQLEAVSEVNIDFNRHRGAVITLSHMQNGLIIDIAAHTILNKPLVIVHSAANVGSAHYRHHLMLGECAQACVIELNQAPQNALQSVLTSVELASDSHYQHYTIEMSNSQGHYISGLHLQQQQNSTCFCYCQAQHNQLARYDIHAHLHGAGASCSANGTYRLAAQQHSDHNILVEHQASHTTSTQFYKGVVQGNAHAVFNGKAIIHSNTHDTAAHQHNHNLLLSRRAEINTKPELEIYSDAVNCTHGATVGQLDAQQLFYLQSRGVESTMAKQLLTQAFTAEVQTTISHPQVAAYLKQGQQTDNE